MNEIKDNLDDLFQDEQEVEREEQSVNEAPEDEAPQSGVGIAGVIAADGAVHIELIGRPTPDQLRTITGKMYHDTNDMLLAGRIMDAFVQVQMMANTPYKAGK
jgi:hypothetical protein